MLPTWPTWYHFDMAKTQSISYPDELKNLQAKAIEQRDRFILGVVQGHKREPSKAQKRLLKRPAVINSPQVGRGSLFSYLSPFWQTLTDTQKDVWRSAALFSSLNNWQLFISDNAARIRNDITFPVPPSVLWQVRAGRLKIENPATELILKQEHPQSYYVAQKIVGASWKREVVKLDEVFGFPLDLELRYQSDLTPVGPTQSARYFARVWSSYQGVDRYTDCVVTIDPQSGWKLGTASISKVVGHVIGYTLYLEIIGYTGEVLFDNIRAVHGGTNWALDPRCDDVSKTFSKGFAAVPPFWIPVALPSGATFATEYPPAL